MKAKPSMCFVALRYSKENLVSFCRIFENQRRKELHSRLAFMVYPLKLLDRNGFWLKPNIYLDSSKPEHYCSGNFLPQK